MQIETPRSSKRPCQVHARQGFCIGRCWTITMTEGYDSVAAFACEYEPWATILETP
jgi:hypothetical protein